jgi:hypothetical protein
MNAIYNKASRDADIRGPLLLKAQRIREKAEALPEGD